MPKKIGMFWPWVVEEKEVLGKFLSSVMINVYPKSIRKLGRLNNGTVVWNKAWCRFSIVIKMS